MSYRLSACLLASALALFAGESRHPKHPRHPRHPKRVGGPVHTAKEAKAIAEQETGGKAVSARKVPLNGATCGWEVEVHMPKDDRGWKCTIDCDTHMVYTKTRIDQPVSRGRH